MTRRLVLTVALEIGARNALPACAWVPSSSIGALSLAFWAPDKGPELRRRWREFCNACPDEITSPIVYLHAPPFDFVPKDVQLKPGYALVVAGTDISKAEQAVKDICSFGPPLFDIIGPMPYLALQGMFDSARPRARRPI